jgi:cephalosporin-C deacetylase
MTLPHAYPFDPTYGYTPEGLLAIEPPPEPDDFAAFWKPLFDATVATPLNTAFTDVPSRDPDYRIRLVRFDGWNGVQLGAWLVRPAHTGVGRFIVVGHGYYNRPIEDVWFAPGTAALFLACRGLGLSRTAGLSDQTMLHVLNGIEDKANYVHRGCVADTWSAASLMLQAFPEAAGRLEYSGESFGGGIGAMALAWDERFSFAQLRVPSFGHQPLRLRCPCTGSGEAVRRKWERWPEIYDRTLRYFDAAAHARRIRTPTHYACALFDPAVPPPGQFAVYNAAAGPKRLTIWQTGHHDWPGTAEDVRRADAEAEEFCRCYVNA